MENPPLVSVVVPVYNMAGFLGETLKSVLATRYSPLEVIVMDDGSSDNSLKIAEDFSHIDNRVKAYSQKNAGACAARNHAISLAKGFYILPVDADNTITPTFIPEAVALMQSDPELKVVAPRADFFGDRTGEWKLPPFSLSLLARKNIMDTCALYKRSEWERIGGYCEEIVAREDWEFWINMLKDGGKVARLPEISLHYRIRSGSKRVSDRSLKRHVIDVLNKRHADFFERELGGPLRYNRSWSHTINGISRFFFPRKVVVDSSENQETKAFMNALPECFKQGGDVIYKGRNTLKRFNVGGRGLIVKSYAIPHIVNRVAYRLLRPTKAKRSYLYGKMLVEASIGSPRPVGYVETGSWLFIGHTYSVGEESECKHTFRDFAKQTFANRDDILRAIARTTARMHEHGWLHKDYSAGNILFRTRTGCIS